MLDFEGNISEPSRISKHAIMFDNDDYGVTYLASTMCSITGID